MAAFLLLDRQARRQMRRERVFRDRTRDLDSLSEQKLVECYRFRRAALIHIIRKVEDNLTSPTQRSHAISAETKVLGTLRFLAKGSFYSEVGQIIGVSKASQSRYINSVIDAIRQLAPQVIRFPDNPGDVDKLKEGFYNIAGFPNTIGAVDGTQIQMLRPTENEELYVCRKGYHSINCQAICDHELRFLNFVAKWPGSTHDSFMFNDCSVKRRLERGDFGNAWLIGDSAYTLSRFMMIPFYEPANRPEQRYNSAHARTRCSIERAFGIMKLRFRAIHKTGGAVPFKPEKACRMFQAIAVLHNMAIDFKTPLPPGADDPDYDDTPVDDVHFDDAAPNETEGSNIRRDLVRARFT